MTVCGSAVVAATEDTSWSVVRGRVSDDVLLEPFEKARGALCIARTGNGGLFPGYDRLQLAAAYGGEGIVVVTARVTSRSVGRHEVEYEAQVLEIDEHPERRILARAAGATLEYEAADEQHVTTSEARVLGAVEALN